MANYPKAGLREIVFDFRKKKNISECSERRFEYKYVPYVTYTSRLPFEQISK